MTYGPNMKVMQARGKSCHANSDGLFLDKICANLWYLMYMYLYKFLYVYVCHSTVPGYWLIVHCHL